MTSSTVPTRREELLARVPGSVRRALLVLAGTGCASFLILAVAASVGELPKVDLHLSLAWLGLAVAAFLVFQLVVMEVWAWVLREVGAEIARSKSYAIYAVSLLTRYVPTQLPMAVSRVELGFREGVPRGMTVAGIAYEIILGLGTACGLSIGFFLSLDAVQHQPARWLVLGAPLAVLMLLHPRLVAVLERSVARRLGTEPVVMAVPLRRLVPLVITNLLLLLLAGLATWALARGLAPVDAPGMKAVTAYAVGAAAAVAAFMLPAGIGARDAAVAAALSTAMPFSIAMTAAILVRLVQTAIELIYAAGTTIWARRVVARAASLP